MEVALGIVGFTVSVLPMPKAITGKFTGSMNGAKLNVTNIGLPVVATMRNDDPISVTRIIMVVCDEFLSNVQVPITVEVANMSRLTIGLPAASNSAFKREIFSN